MRRNSAIDTRIRDNGGASGVGGGRAGEGAARRGGRTESGCGGDDDGKGPRRLDGSSPSRRWPGRPGRPGRTRRCFGSRRGGALSPAPRRATAAAPRCPSSGGGRSFRRSGVCVRRCGARDGASPPRRRPRPRPLSPLSPGTPLPPPLLPPSSTNAAVGIIINIHIMGHNYNYIAASPRQTSPDASRRRPAFPRSPPPTGRPPPTSLSHRGHI